MLVKFLNLLALDATTCLPTTTRDAKILYEKVETIQSSSDIPTGTEAVTVPNSQDIDILSSRLDSKKENLGTVFDSWLTKVSDNESERRKNIEWSRKINDSLNHQLQNGFLSNEEYIDLEYISRVWIKLMNATSTYNLGTICNKKDILSLLLELLELKQISKSVFIESVLQL